MERDDNDLWIETYNCNLDKNIGLGRFKAQMGVDSATSYKTGLKMYNNIIQQKGIYLYQEVRDSIKDDFTRDNIYVQTIKNCTYFNEDVCFLVGDPVNTGCMLLTYQVSFRKPGGSAKNAIVMKEFTDHEMVRTQSYNAVVWTPQFELDNIRIPRYVVDDQDKTYGNRTGHRTTPWVLLKDRYTGKMYATISIHGNSGEYNPKRIELIRSLCKEADSYAALGMSVIVGGDLNMDVEELGLTFSGRNVPSQNNQEFKDIINKTKQMKVRPSTLSQISPSKYLKHTFDNKVENFPVTHINIQNNFRGSLDWIFVSKDMNVKTSIVDKLEIPNARNPSDHTPVRIVVDDSLPRKRGGSGSNSGSNYDSYEQDDIYKEKYLKYKSKYINLKNN